MQRVWEAGEKHRAVSGFESGAVTWSLSRRGPTQVYLH
jgi:hypothetical protein